MDTTFGPTRAVHRLPLDQKIKASSHLHICHVQFKVEACMREKVSPKLAIMNIGKLYVQTTPVEPELGRAHPITIVPIYVKIIQ